MLTRPPLLELVYQPLPTANDVTFGDIFSGAGNAVCPPCARDLIAVVVESFGAAA